MEGPLVSDTTEILGGAATASEDAPAAAGATASTSKSRSRGGTGLSSLLMPELQRIAQTLAIPGAGRMRKSQLIEAIEAGADEAVMLDPQGFVSSCNATNLFFAADGNVFTSTGTYCFNGVTRANVIGLCHDHGIPVTERDFGLEEALGADEAFVTGTLGGIAPVGALDGQVFAAAPGPVTEHLAGLYEGLKDADADAHPLA